MEKDECQNYLSEPTHQDRGRQKSVAYVGRSIHEGWLHTWVMDAWIDMYVDDECVDGRVHACVEDGCLNGQTNS